MLCQRYDSQNSLSLTELVGGPNWFGLSAPVPGLNRFGEAPLWVGLSRILAIYLTIW